LNDIKILFLPLEILDKIYLNRDTREMLSLK